MKKIHKILVVVGLMVSGSSCNYMLNPEPRGTQTIDVTFTDFSGSLAAVNGIYSVLSGGNLYRGSNNMLEIDLASDDVMNQSKVTSGSYSLVDYFELVANNGQTFGLWDDFYRIIYRSNLVINRVPNIVYPIAQTRNSAGTLFKDQFVGEAKFMRAFAYFNLVRLFGDVPLRTSEIKSAGEVNIPRAPTAQVYNQIMEDLKDAAEKLPPSYSGSGNGNEKGRPTRWTALTMLADLFLTQKNYSEARTTANQILSQSGLSLNARYADNFAARGGQENSAESLFEIQFSNGGATVGTASLGNGYSFLMGATNEANGGVPSLANYRPTSTLDPENESGFKGGLIQEFEVGDLRRDVCFTQGRSGTGAIQWLTIKHHVAGTGSVGQANFPIYRLSEVMLILAEATNEASVLDASSLEQLNRLRRRAFGLPLATASPQRDIAIGLTQDQYRELIRSERRKELAVENKRWFDLLRYGFDYTNLVLKSNQQRNNFTREKMLFPIAQNELINNPQLTQNPGY
jgi:starch-binding outer membrane protein, SusD/RagB family